MADFKAISFDASPRTKSRYIDRMLADVAAWRSKHANRVPREAGWEETVEKRSMEWLAARHLDGATQVLLAMADSALEKQDLKSAREAIESALSGYRNTGGSEFGEALLLRAYGNVYRAQGDFENAEFSYDLALDNVNKFRDVEGTDVADVSIRLLIDMASMARDRDRYETSYSYMQNALEIHCAAYPWQHDELSKLLGKMSKSDKESFQASQFQVWSALRRSDRKALEHSLYFLARNSLIEFDQAATVRVLLEAIVVKYELLTEGKNYISREVLPSLKLPELGNEIDVQRLFGETETLVVRQYFPNYKKKLADAMLDLYLFTPNTSPEEGVELLRQVLATYQEVYQEQDHIDIANAMNYLAVALARADKSEEALVLYKQSLEMLRRLYPFNHPAMFNRMSNIANEYLKQDQLEAARAQLAIAFEGGGPLMAVGHHQILRLVELEQELCVRLEDRACQLENMNTRIQGVLEKYGEEHPRYGLAILEAYQLEKSEVREETSNGADWQLAKKVADKTWGRIFRCSYSGALEFISQLADVLEAEEDFEGQAETLERQIICLEATGAKTIEVVQANYRLGSLLNEMDRYQAAKERLEKALELSYRVNPSPHRVQSEILQILPLVAVGVAQDEHQHIDENVERQVIAYTEELERVSKQVDVDSRYFSLAVKDLVLGLLRVFRGDIDSGKRYLDSALSLYSRESLLNNLPHIDLEREHDSWVYINAILNSTIGRVLANFDNLADAIDYQSLATELVAADKLGNAIEPAEKIDIQCSYAESLAATGQHSLAITVSENALSHYVSTSGADILDSYVCYRVLANSKLIQGEFYDAKSTLERLLVEFNKYEATEEVSESRAEILNTLATLEHSVGNRKGAIEYLSSAAEALDAVDGLSATLGASLLRDAGIVSLEIRDFKKAKKFIQGSIDIMDSLFVGDSTRSQASKMFLMGQLNTGLRRFKAALYNFETSIELNESLQIPDLAQLAEAYTALGKLQATKGLSAEADSSFVSALGLGYEGNEGQKASTEFSYARFLYNRNLGSDREFAIALAKKAVDRVHSMKRQVAELGKSSIDMYQEDTRTYYENLAAWLLKAKRFYEAEQIMDLLKEREVSDYQLRSVSQNRNLEYSPTEKEVLDAFNEHSAEVYKIQSELRKLTRARDTSTPGQQKIADKVRKLEQLRKDGDAFRASFQASVKSQSLNRIGNTKTFVDLLLATKGKTALGVRFAFQDDEVVIFAVGPNSPNAGTSFLSRVKREVLEAKIFEYRRLLKNRSRAVQALPQEREQLKRLANELYDSLLAPLEPLFEYENPEYLVFVLNNPLQMIPMSTLFDGDSYLGDRFKVVRIPKYHVNSPVVARNDAPCDSIVFDAKEGKEDCIVALGLSEVVNPKRKAARLEPLRWVENEIDVIVRDRTQENDEGILPGVAIMNRDLTRTSFKGAINSGSPYLHVASHFVNRMNINASTLYLGGPNDDEELTVGQIADGFNSGVYVGEDIRLAFLAACDTATPGSQSESVGINTASIDGLADTFIGMGRVGSVIATLWAVSDRSTSVFSARFYQYLAEGLSAGAALQAAKSDFISKMVDCKQYEGATKTCDWSDPYHWAPFVLLGQI